MAKAKDSSAALVERLASARADAEEWLDRKAEELQKTNPSIPVGVLRQMLTARSFGNCPCLAVINHEDK